MNLRNGCAGLLVAGIACGGNVGPPAMNASDAAGDAPSDAMSSVGKDAASEGGDGGCTMQSPKLPQTPCTPTLDAICQQWAAQAAVGAYGHSRCFQDPQTGITACADPNCGGVCWCGPGVTTCNGATQVCASDTPGGALHCIAACGQ
jgi:hypothetical protein